VRRVASALLLGLVSCDEAPKAARPTDASALPGASARAPRDTAEQPEPEGCLRAGSLEGIETEASCVLVRAADDVMRDFSKRVRVDVKPDAEIVAAGSETHLRVTLTNIATTETLVVFDAYSRAPGPRPDYARLVGVPEARAGSDAGPHLHFNVVTTDSYERNVDDVPTIAGSATTSPPRLIGVRLRPGARLGLARAWFATRIPAPPPIVTDDAGHRFIPKTGAFPLTPGDYVAHVELPLHGLGPAERTFATKLKVEPGAETRKHKH
jgi:hypothetical protein